MQLQDFFEFEKLDTKFGPVERIRLKGHRIDVAQIIRLFNQGMSPERIRQRLPTLSLEQVYATITYYLGRTKEVDEYINQADKVGEAFYQDWLAAPPSPALQRMRELKAQQQSEQAAS